MIGETAHRTRHFWFSNSRSFLPRCTAFALALKHSSQPQLGELADRFLEENLPVFLGNLQLQTKVKNLLWFKKRAYKFDII